MDPKHTLSTADFMPYISLLMTSISPRRNTRASTRRLKTPTESDSPQDGHRDPPARDNPVWPNGVAGAWRA